MGDNCEQGGRFTAAFVSTAGCGEGDHDSCVSFSTKATIRPAQDGGRWKTGRASQPQDDRSRRPFRRWRDARNSREHQEPTFLFSSLQRPLTPAASHLITRRRARFLCPLPVARRGSAVACYNSGQPRPTRQGQIERESGPLMIPPLHALRKRFGKIRSRTFASAVGQPWLL